MSQQKLKVIIIEDDEDEQFFMHKGFVSSGLFDVVAILYSGADFFKALNDSILDRPDVILTDLHMHGLNGYEILEVLKNKPLFADIPVVIISNISSFSINEKCKSLGAYGHKLKPDSFSDYGKFAKSLYDELIKK